MAVNYNLEAEQGSDFIFHVKYIDDANSPVDLSGMTAEMQVRRHSGSSSTLAEWATSATGDWDSSTVTTGSTGGSGGIRINATYTGGTYAGQSGSTGGIWVIADPTTMSNVPTGQHHYDLELNLSNSTIRLVEGRFEVKGNVTR
tara:strand:+ start:29 stop:460 length:432 start_codon:yes stop_codon:yes gene_type:complete